MSDSILITITDGEGDYSPSLWCRWAGLKAVKCLLNVTSRSWEIQNLMCNLIIQVMDGTVRPDSFCVYNYNGKHTGMDLVNGSWVYNTKQRCFIVYDRFGKDRAVYTIDQVNDIIDVERPDLR